jgi:hypothetical protein
MFQMAIEYTNIFSFQGPLKFTQIGIFGLKIYHLITLAEIASRKMDTWAASPKPVKVGSFRNFSAPRSGLPPWKRMNWADSICRKTRRPKFSGRQLRMDCGHRFNEWAVFF